MDGRRIQNQPARNSTSGAHYRIRRGSLSARPSTGRLVREQGSAKPGERGACIRTFMFRGDGRIGAGVSEPQRAAQLQAHIRGSRSVYLSPTANDANCRRSQRGRCRWRYRGGLRRSVPVLLNPSRQCIRARTIKRWRMDASDGDLFGNSHDSSLRRH